MKNHWGSQWMHDIFAKYILVTEVKEAYININTVKPGIIRNQGLT